MSATFAHVTRAVICVIEHWVVISVAELNLIATIDACGISGAAIAGTWLFRRGPNCTEIGGATTSLTF